jgi:ubiquinone biosynthesis protein Coq4
MTNKQKTAKLRKFLKARPSLKPQSLEKEAGLPTTTLSQIFQDRELPEKHWPALEKALKKYCWE